jgi:hypothetical protein
MYLLVSVGLYQRMGNAGHAAYRLTSAIGNCAAIIGILATFAALVLGSRFERSAMLVMLAPYAPLIFRAIARLIEVLLVI